ncbi:MAG: 5-formyltetrahydrofolate cyclo-ligase [Prevotella sp.]|nr:5-formyltetrahydrofolate cyclo-ligase [Prevotella sp.]
MLKSELRQQIRALKRQFTQQQLDELSLPIISRLRPHLAEAHTILAFYSLADEVNTHQLLDDLVAEGKTVLLPKVLDDETMELRHYTGRQDLVEGTLHIQEPVGEPFTDYTRIDIALIPGMAFDAQGHRLGRGKGYYDRFFTLHSSLFTTIGVCFDFQKVDEVPVDAYDMPVDEVV